MCPFHPALTGVEMNLGSCASAPLPPHSTPGPPSHLLTLSMGQSRAPLPKWHKVGMGKWQCEEQVSCLSLRGGVGGRMLDWVLLKPALTKPTPLLTSAPAHPSDSSLGMK